MCCCLFGSLLVSSCPSFRMCCFRHIDCYYLIIFPLLKFIHILQFTTGIYPVCVNMKCHAIQASLKNIHITSTIIAYFHFLLKGWATRVQNIFLLNGGGKGIGKLALQKLTSLGIQNLRVFILIRVWIQPPVKFQIVNFFKIINFKAAIIA